MLLAHRGMVHQVEPVGVRIEQQAVVLRRVLQYGGPELRRVQHRGQPRDGCGGHAAAVLDPRPPLSRFRGDQHHAVGGVRPVDRGGRGVLEHRDALDVPRIQEVEGVAAGREAPARAGAQRHAIQDVERLAARVHRRLTADADRETVPRTVVVHDLDARDLVLDQLLWAEDRAGVEVLGRDLRDGAGDVARALLTIADDHDLGQAHRLGPQGEIDDDRVAPHDGDRLRRRRVSDHSRAR